MHTLTLVNLLFSFSITKVPFSFISNPPLCVVSKKCSQLILSFTWMKILETSIPKGGRLLEQSQRLWCVSVD